ncbi:hypothetical protein PENSUB_6761 [Penicillium subrubescens]|uniref:Uncharacterized protein n=1 Tax=Penicillium subrubescens TaxID=1316194 RepID=A0A1Q5TVL8_9EURO|nr:hypothetical protein PENSUB_6761 [Penicillium subrubescens]
MTVTGNTGPRGTSLQHILEQHSKEFAKYEPQRLVEFAKASTSVVLYVSSLSRGTRTRPISDFFYTEPVTVTVQVGSNGFVVSINSGALEKIVKKNLQHWSVNELAKIRQRSHS